MKLFSHLIPNVVKWSDNLSSRHIANTGNCKREGKAKERFIGVCVCLCAWKESSQTHTHIFILTYSRRNISIGTYPTTWENRRTNEKLQICLSCACVTLFKLFFFNFISGPNGFQSLWQKIYSKCKIKMKFKSFESDSKNLKKSVDIFRHFFYNDIANFICMHEEWGDFQPVSSTQWRLINDGIIVQVKWQRNFTHIHSITLTINMSERELWVCERTSGRAHTHTSAYKIFMNLNFSLFLFFFFLCRCRRPISGLSFGTHLFSHLPVPNDFWFGIMTNYTQTHF